MGSDFQGCIVESLSELVEEGGNAAVTIEPVFEDKQMQTGAKKKSRTNMRRWRRLASFTQPMQVLQECLKEPFHGDNTGSNPVGDAK
jgi:hypothetical protein